MSNIRALTDEVRDLRGRLGLDPQREADAPNPDSGIARSVHLTDEGPDLRVPRPIHAGAREDRRSTAGGRHVPEKG
jgi:hypothetical protein